MVLKMQKIGKSINSIHLRAYPAYENISYKHYHCGTCKCSIAIGKHFTAYKFRYINFKYTRAIDGFV